MQSATDSTTKAVVAIVDFLTANWEKLLYTLLIVIIAFALIRVLKAFIGKFGRDEALTPGTVSFLQAVVKYGILFFAAINILGIYSFTYIYSLILSLGLISVVIALGSQTIISNLMGGIIVYIERPFKPGDIIKVGENTGEVDGISFRSTTLRGLNGLNIVVPNSTFLTVPIVNYTRTRSYLLKVPFVMPRATDISNLLSAIKEHIQSLPGVRYDMDMHVYKSKITPDNIDYEFHVWVKDPRDSERATSAVIDVINDFYKKPLKEKA
ncbi:putative small-conductance mechanosensitive channel [Methanocella paludicola SANAE]|uniref:Small-conductance mechanosensitive channel n=1 Tax=Methanocella paludicola (strain DSM 17711 / JCM 13418 / NBRC 101707 / SANAE) TaxID=304371 RepID=D1YYE4_METPS|nr:mechanosensitive ion channel domain-containing protein [Methanocella paludicola]BAI61466.1 putative small-conductance mechanosensitive channel [Methanocella paludicola SANAE]